MAKFRLRSAHVLRNSEVNNDVWLPGDKENEHLGDEKGTLVGDGTPYPVVSATIEMIPLDDAAQDMIEAEHDRLSVNSASMSPVDQLAMTMNMLQDNYERGWVPGFPGTPRPQKGA